jgi:cysteinyl-tRNA synthetase
LTVFKRKFNLKTVQKMAAREQFKQSIKERQRRIFSISFKQKKVSEIEQKIHERNQARESKDWKTSDLLREDLLKHGVQIQDTRNGTKWTVVL